MQLVEVKNRFLKDESKQTELEVVLSSQDSQQSEPRIIVYGGSMDFVDAVRVQFSNTGKMNSIKCHRGSANRLEKKIEDEIYTDHGKAVGRRIIFTNTKITGQFRLNNDFQIIPVPPVSPELKTPVGDHPAVLEFSYNKSPHHILDSHRCSERANELACLLSAFVFHGIKWINNHCDKYWVIDKPEGKEKTAHYRQESYSCGDWEKKDGISFSIPDNTPEIPLMEPSAYFGRLGIDQSRVFNLPSNVDAYFNKYETLSPEEKKMARLSAHWLQKSRIVHSTSVSLSFSAIIFALESLIHAPEQKGKCESCGQAIYQNSVSQCFRELIETYAEGIPRADVNDIYAMRSKIVHGSDLMRHDQNVGFQFSDPLMKSRFLYLNAWGICQVVFINWLVSRG